MHGNTSAVRLRDGRDIDGRLAALYALDDNINTNE